MEVRCDSSSNQTRNWCDLPDEVLFRIAVCMDWRTHLAHLRAVCKAWRSSLPLSNFPIFSGLKVPPLEPLLSNELVLLTHRFYFMSPLRTSHQGGSDPLGGRWLARMCEIGTNTWHLFNPLNMERYFLSSPPITGSIDPLDCRILELACVFCLVNRSVSAEPKPITKKIVHNVNVKSAYRLSVLAQLERGNGGGLFLFRWGDTRWIQIQEDDDACRILDIASYKDKFYVFDLSSWQIRLINPANPSDPTEFIRAPGAVGDPIDDMQTFTLDGCLYFFKNSYFVPSNGRLYLVMEVRKQPNNSNKNVVMIVFVLKEQEDEEGCKWERVQSLGDRIFFIGYDACFSLPSPSRNLPQWKPNSICLFTWPLPMMFDGHVEGRYGKKPEGAELLKSITYARYWMYFRIFNLEEEDRGVLPFERLPKRLYTGLFFPPPAWVKWHCPRLENSEVRLDGLQFHDFGVPFDEELE